MDESSASRVVGLFQDGGFTMPFLGMCLFILWFAIGYRSILLRPRRGFQPTVVLNPSRITRTSTHWLDRAAKVTADAMRHGDLLLRERLEADLTPLRKELQQHAHLIKTLAAVAPLLGLLGTVGGMIETFDSLAGMNLFTQSGGIGGGVAQALITTQFGLIIAVPGLLFGAVLEQRQRHFEDQLDAMVDLLCTGEGQ